MVQQNVQQAISERMAAGWKPTHSSEASEYLKAYLKDADNSEMKTDRLVKQRCDLSHTDMHTIINDRSIGSRFFEILADFMHPSPEHSIYISPMYGEFHGQKNIREWLIPTMQQAGSYAFDARCPARFFDDGEGGTSVDEWQLTSYQDGKWKPLVSGISIRKFRDGWITYASDHFNTLPSRMAAQAKGKAMPLLPEFKSLKRYTGPMPELSPHAREVFEQRETVWKQAAAKRNSIPTFVDSNLTNRELFELAYNEVGHRWELVGDVMHPTDSEYHDPIFGVISGQDNIRAWMIDIMGKAGNVMFEPLGPPLFDGETSFEETRQMAIQPNGEKVFMVRGASIRRYLNGYAVYAQDYFDVAPMLDPAVHAASLAAGSVITPADIEKYRN